MLFVAVRPGHATLRVRGWLRGRLRDWEPQNHEHLSDVRASYPVWTRHRIMHMCAEARAARVLYCIGIGIGIGIDIGRNTRRSAMIYMCTGIGSRSPHEYSTTAAVRACFHKREYHTDGDATPTRRRAKTKRP